MRFQYALATAAVSALILVNSTLAFAQFNYISQNRSISVDAIATHDVPPFVEDMKSSTAPDFTAFVNSLSAMATVDAVSSQATASQNSPLASTSITAFGSVSGSGFRASASMVGYATADSVFSSTFTLDALTDVQIAVNLFAHHGATNPTSSDSSTAAFSLTVGAINLSQVTSFTDGVLDSSAQCLQTLSLPSGTYSVTASAHSFSGSPTFSETVNRINSLSSNASYSVSISIVPEPPALALLAIGAVILLGPCAWICRPPQPRSAAPSGQEY